MHDEAVVQGAQLEQRYKGHVEGLHHEFKDRMAEKKRLLDASIAQQIALQSAPRSTQATAQSRLVA